MKTIALLVLVVACGGAVDPDPVGAKPFLIPAKHCGVLTSSDGEEIRIGAEPDALGVNGYRIEYSVSSDFRFYAEHAQMCLGKVTLGESCSCETKESPQ